MIRDERVLKRSGGRETASRHEGVRLSLLEKVDIEAWRRETREREMRELIHAWQESERHGGRHSG